MLSPYAPPQSEAPTSRGLLWVFQAAAALLAIAAWLVLMLHLVLILRAEFKLQSVMDQAQAFSELPQVNRGELASYIDRRLAQHGFAESRVSLQPEVDKPGVWQVSAIRAAPGETVPERFQWLAERLGSPNSVTVTAAPRR